MPEVFQRLQRLTVPMALLPCRFVRHAKVVEPIADAYAALYEARYGWPIQAERLERFLEYDLGLSYGWEEITEPEGTRILALHDPTSGAIWANARYADQFDAQPCLLVSSLLHELGHIALRHGEHYAEGECLPGIPATSPFLHRADWHPWGMSDALRQRAVKVAFLDPQVGDRLKPSRFEPDWVYQQAQRFAAAGMISQRRLHERLRTVGDLTNWHPVYTLAREFGASPSMMRYRLETLEYICVQGRHSRPGARLKQLSLW
jgi:hypothetical protein